MDYDLNCSFHAITEDGVKIEGRLSTPVQLDPRQLWQKRELAAVLNTIQTNKDSIRTLFIRAVQAEFSQLTSIEILTDRATSKQGHAIISTRTLRDLTFDFSNDVLLRQKLSNFCYAGNTKVTFRNLGRA